MSLRGATFPLINASFRLRVLSANLQQGFRGRRHFLNFVRKFKPAASGKTTLLGEDDLLHPFSQSPFPAVKARGEAIRSFAPCPICSPSHGGHGVHDDSTKPSRVKFECPDCGWPTHCSREHWEMDENHAKFCPRLREVNEDEHDLRSGRRMHEFELPGMSSTRFLGPIHLTSLLRRISSIRGSHLICQLGSILVYARFLFNGHGTIEKACEQVAYLSDHHRLCSTSE